jgi:winged helix DNA-binding protein
VTTGILSLRDLNRATLARQLLVRRAGMSAWNAVEWLGGLEAQSTDTPYISLWTRLEHFQVEDLANSIEERKTVRAPLMRDVDHLVTAADYRMWRPALQPVLEAGYRLHCGQMIPHFNLERILGAAQVFLAEEPRTMLELQDFLSGLQPGDDPVCLAHTVRTWLPMVQVPPAGLWGVYESPAYALAEDWLGPQQVPTREGLRHLVVRYLGAFGPACCADVETWIGMAHLQEVLDELVPGLQTFRDEDGRVLYDLPDAPRPGGEMEIPPRFLPHDDNLMIAYADNRRLTAGGHNREPDVPPAPNSGCFLVDGFIAGSWRIERADSTASMHLQAFDTLPEPVANALVAEGESLARFVEEDAELFEVQVEGRG